MPTSHPSATTNSPVKLKFDDKLTGRGLSSEGLQRKLKSLLDELSSITESEPENIDLASFATVRKDLVGPSLMLHKDKGVKAYTACCIAELLNIYAPDAPYTAGELKDIFQFFFRQLLSGLKGPDAPYYQLYHDLLSSLSRTKSAVLVCDLPQADDLLVEIFRDFFTLAALGLPTTIEAYMADIMAALLDECQTVPSEVADILIKQFSTKKSATSVPAFRVAVEVCNASSDKLIRPVCQYFTDAIVQHPQSDHEDGDDGDGERDVDALRAAHTLVKRIHKYCPKLLLNVIPQMHEELQVDNTEVRTLATQTLGEMYAETHGSDLMREYRSTWVLWVARKNDKIPAIRLVFVSVAKKLIGNPDMRNDINDAMLAKALDPDDKVRAAVCKAYGELDFEMSAYHASEKMLRTIAGRCLDKKHTVRLEAFDTIGRLYSQARPEIEKGNPTAISQFGWIPSQLIHASGTTPDVALVAEGIIARDILPLPSIKEEMDENAWTQRLLSIMVAGERRTFDGLMFLSSLSTTRPSQYQAFVDSCLQFNGGTIDKDEAAVKTKLQQVIRLIAAGYPNPSKVADDLQTFAKHHDRRLYKYLRTIMDIETDLKGLVKAKHEFTKIIEKDVPAIAGTMEAFMRKSSLWIVNTSSIPTFLDILSSSGNATASRNGHNTNGDKDETINGKSVDYARATLNYISKYCPQLYYPHLQRLAKVAHSKGNYVAQECALRALASVARLGTDQFPNDSRLDSLMVSLAVSNNRTNAKAAARYLSNGRNSAKHSSSLVEKLCKLLPKADDEHLVAHIAALSEFTRYSPDEFEEKSEDIVRFLLRDLVHRTPDAVSMDIDEESDAANVEWCPRDDLHPLIHAKRGVMRLLTNRCLAHKDGNDAEKVAQPVIKLLADVLDQDGSFAPIKDLGPDYDRLKDRREGGPPARSWMRLKAVNCLLRLARQDKLVKVVNTRLTTIALVAQDFCWNVRNAFITKVTGLLKKNQINPVFNTVVFLTCHDPEDNIRSRAQIYVVTMMRRLSPQQKLRCFEQIFVRYLYLLAHHPDFDTSDHEEGLPALAKYIEFYLELVADNDNVSLLFYLAQQLKTVRDNDGDQYSENIYLLSELAEYIIKQWAANHSWTLVPYPGKVSMPPDSFTLLPVDVAKRVRTKVYLTDGMIGCLSEVGKSLKPAPAKRKRRAAGSAIPKSSKRPVKRRKKEESDEEDEIEESDEGSAESGAEHPAPTSDEEMVSDVEESTEHSRSRSPELGRGARSRAKAKAQQKTKKGKKRDG